MPSALERLMSRELLSELHKLLWLDPFVNRGVPDLGWSCRDHALIAGALLKLADYRVAVVHGRACYVQGPAPGRRPVGLDQALHSWLEIEGSGVVDLSPNLSTAMHPDWVGVPFNGIAKSHWAPEGAGRLVFCSGRSEYEEEITIASNAERGFCAIYLPEKRQPFSTDMLARAFEFVNSPLTDLLRRRYRSSVYAKAIVHMTERLDENCQSLSGVSRNKAWAIIARRPEECVPTLIAEIERRQPA